MSQSNGYLFKGNPKAFLTGSQFVLQPFRASGACARPFATMPVLLKERLFPLALHGKRGALSRHECRTGRRRPLSPPPSASWFVIALHRHPLYIPSSGAVPAYAIAFHGPMQFNHHLTCCTTKRKEGVCLHSTSTILT